MTLILPDHYHYLFRTSFLTLLTCLYELYRGYYIMAMLALSVTTTSIVYWWHPDYSWRRYLDIVVVQSAIGMQSIIVWNAEYAYLYYPILAIGVACYPLGIYYYSVQHHASSALAHSGVHIIINIATLVVCSGKLE